MAFYSENLSRLFSEKITAVFAVSDHYALEFMRFLQGQGIRRLEARLGRGDNGLGSTS